MAEHNRRDALERVAALVWAWTVGGVIALLVLVFGLIIGTIDILWQLVTDGDGIAPDSSMSVIIAATLNWYTDLHIYAFTGQGGLSLLPGVFT